MFLHVDIVLHGATYVVVFTDTDQMPPPYRVDNFAEVCFDLCYYFIVFHITHNIGITTTTATTTILRTLYRSACVCWHHSQELEDFVGAKFYYLHVFADNNWCIQIRENMLDFS